MNLLKKWTFSLLLPATMIGCASVGTATVPRFSTLLHEQTQQNGRACIRDYQIRGYSVKHGNILTIDAGRKHYVATTFNQCHNLDLSFEAAFVSRHSQICGGSSRVITRNENCTIDKIFEFENRELAKQAVQMAHEAQTQAKENAKELREISRRAEELAELAESEQ